MTRIGQGGLVTLALALLVGCAERELILPGQRLDTRVPLADSLPEGEVAGAATPLTPVPDQSQAENRALPVNLPPAQRLDSWPQRGANPQHLLPHLALGPAPKQVWSADIGQGNDRRHRITADPVADGGRIFTLDSHARVTATSTSGATLWTADLTPPGESGDASGGGLAVAGGRLFATSGFGTLTALDAATGAVIWTQALGAVGNAAPAVAGDLVYVIGRDNRAWAVRTADGKVEWAVSGTPSPSGYVGGGGAAVDNRIAVLPFANGEIMAVLRRSGLRTWGAELSGRRRGQVYATINDIAADPVLVGNTVYAGSAAGRLVAADAGSGERLWTATEGTLAPVILAGDALFLVSDHAELVRLDANTGERVWGTPLPNFVKDKDRRRKTVYAHFGPILAGGRIIVASTDGLIRQFDPVSGALTGQIALPGGAASNPIVVGGTLYVVSASGKLIAFR